ncbi:hypothetical protein [Umezawaea tangerina]|uniref:hypothetical protein n=1 Tax=Umezawaea tangerina TaxID=84725 RepID=UPI0011B1F06F|nr:hypothetical protein [Umezawaea tangerina]
MTAANLVPGRASRPPHQEGPHGNDSTPARARARRVGNAAADPVRTPGVAVRGRAPWQPPVKERVVDSRRRANAGPNTRSALVARSGRRSQPSGFALDSAEHTDGGRAPVTEDVRDGARAHLDHLANR